MTKREKAMVNPAVLTWARRRAQLSPEELAARLRLADAERIARWEAGEEQPTFTQARTLANTLRIPFGYLFLREVPRSELTLPDLRTVGSRPGHFSLNLLDVYQDAARKQAWLRERREAQGEAPLAFVGSTRDSADVAATARAIRKVLGLDDSLRESARNWEEYFRELVRRAEAVGIMVLRSSTVGAATNRPLDVEEFRGFAIADEFAPLVFINTADAKAAQIFTLMHELTHIFRAETGVSRPDLERRVQTESGDVEAFCDAVAAEILVPEEALEREWQDGEPLAQAAERLAKVFRVSAMVIARRAYDLGKVPRDELDEVMGRLFAFAHAAKERQKEGEGGPSFLIMVKQRSGALLTAAVVDAVRAGELLYRDAASLLGVKAQHVDRLSAQAG